MEDKRDLVNTRNRVFKASLVDIRMKLAIVNSCLLILQLGPGGTGFNYAVVGGYLVWNIGSLAMPGLRRFVSGFIRYPMLCIDLAVIYYMIMQTGGLDSDLYAFLYLPILAAAVRCNYTGIILWCTLLSTAYAFGVWVSGYFSVVRLVIRIAYFYLAGIFGGFLVRHTYGLTEAVSGRLERKNFDLQRLNKYFKEVSASLDLEQIFTETLKVIHEHNQTPMAAVLIFDIKGNLRIVDCFGWKDEWLHNYQQYPLSKYSLTLAPLLVFKKPLLCPDIRKHDELVHTFAGIPIKSLFAYPLIVNDELIGVIMITDNHCKTISDEESQILVSISNQAGIAIQNAVHLNEEKQKADTDGLTGLFNRRYFNEQIELLASAVHNSGGSLSLILLDVDNFKKYNDTYGHPAGDQLLKKVAKVILDAVREEDIVARYGGEEFAVILKNSKKTLALQIAERMRRAVERIVDLNCSITISLGIGTIPEHAVDAKGLLEFADRSLYAAKQTGKNRVCCGW